MKNLIVSGGKSESLVLIAGKLMSAIKHHSVAKEVSFYRLGMEVPYVAETLFASFKLCSLDLNMPNCFISVENPLVLDEMNPVLAQITGDKMLLSLVVMRRFPFGMSEFRGVHFGQKMYEIASWKHPTEALRPIFLLLSSNFPVWTMVLPRLGKEMSLSI